VSRKRIDLIKERTRGKNFSDQKINQQLQRSMNIVLAKLEAFIENPDVLLKKYQSRNDEQANYIKAVALFKKGKIAESLKLLDQIIVSKNSKRDASELGFLFELKGQILFESGDVKNSALAYDRSIKLLSELDAAQAKIAFSAAILSLKEDDADLLKLAIKRLKEAEIFENENPFLFRQLALAYSKIKDEGRSLLALAEFNLLIDQKEKCRTYAKDAKEKLDKSAVAELLRADDLLELAAEDKKGKEKEKKKN
jgi:predicted Zn-dependent protease